MLRSIVASARALFEPADNVDRPADRACDDPASLLLHHRLLGQRLFQHSCVRFLVALSIALGTVFADRVVGIARLNSPALYLLAGVLFVYNCLVFAVLRGYRDPARIPCNYRPLAWAAHVTIVLDYMFLTVALWLVGGAASPFQAWYILHVIMSGILMSQRAAYAHALIGYLFLASLVLGEWTGILPLQRPVGAVPAAGDFDGRYALTVLVVQGLLIFTTTFLVTGLAHLLRQGEVRLRDVNQELERLSSMRRDFLHITLHDLKSPVSAATMHLNNLGAGLAGELNDKQQEWVDRCKQRMAEVIAFIRDLQTLASLEHGELAEQFEDVAPHTLIQNVVDSHHDDAEQHQHTLVAADSKPLPAVRGEPRLLQEALANLVSNAIKYTPDGGTITVRAARHGHRLRFSVEDNGIGISREDQQRLFNEFSRIRRDDQPQSKAQGTGLGLSIVKRILEAHHGEVGVTSERDQGSTFWFELPL